MSITRFPPNSVWLGGDRTVVNDIAASEAITPGMLVERFNAAGVIRFRKSTETDKAGFQIATEQSMLNLGVDDDYAANDLVESSLGHNGSTWWCLIGSGANLAAGDKLGNAGNGKLKAVGGGIAIATAIENKDNSAGPGDARIRVEVI